MENERILMLMSIDNRKYANFHGCGEFGIPKIYPETMPDCKSWTGFNYVKSRVKNPENNGVHFFLYDYQFLRVWRTPTKYIDLLKKFNCVLSPDFSIYSDYPKAMMIYNHYRKHWLGAYWQSQGIKVIPTISWANEDSFDWCFDGEPENSAVAVSSVGTQLNKETKKAFMKGYDAMLEKLGPETILFFGKVPDEAEGNIIKCPTFYEKFSEMVI
ncbi:MAG: DUF4417 domain-containing protein [Oscillospiraceae bacterium]|nr:DUF4417 domain-containing protein [Oscillospiraceae bacterium]